jgi:hypothetical protein
MNGHLGAMSEYLTSTSKHGYTGSFLFVKQIFDNLPILLISKQLVSMSVRRRKHVMVVPSFEEEGDTALELKGALFLYEAIQTLS